MPPPPPLCFPFSRRSTSSSMRSGSTYSDSASFSTVSDDAVSRGGVSRGGVTFTSSAAISIPQTVVDHKGNKAKPRFESVEKESKGSSKEKAPTRSNSTRIFKTPFTRSKSQDSASYVSPASVKKWSVQDEIDEEDDPVTTVPSLAIVESRPRLIQLRSEMVKQKIDAYVIPSADDHGSEYTALCDRRRLYISGFTGSSGTAVVLAGEAHMFVDSRYWVQAERELSEDWILHRVGDQGISNWDKWLLENVLKPGQKVGLDSRMITHEAAIQLSQRLNAANIQLAFPYRNLVDVIWKDRPVRPRDPIFIQPAEIAGTTAGVKLRNMRQWMDEQAKRNPTGTGPGSTPIAGALVASLDSIAWLLNLRGSDVPYNPLFLSYLFVSRSSTPKRTVLFTGLMKVNEEIRHYLDEIGVDVKEYNDVWNWLRRREWGDGKVIITPKTPYALSCMLTSIRYVVAADYIENTRAIKNDRELEGLESAYERDGSAMVRWLAWLDEKIRKGHEVDEHESGRRLTMFRKEVEGFMGLAYETISASGSNASMPHYVPSRALPGIIDKNTPYLIDSGGQYIDGTCDTTRTMHFGRPSDEQREAYTRVLQGHIAIDTAVFPEGTNGMQLDVLARRALWKDGMNYHHGTGHGFGAFLTVHEGPHSFASTEVLRPGHVLTNEPGFYKEGEFGIRIESALYVVQVAPARAEANQSWLGFKRFTCVPIQTKLIKPTLLTKEETQWVKTHNSLCYKKLAPLIAHDKRAMRWLKRECERDFVPDEKVFNIEW